MCFYLRNTNNTYKSERYPSPFDPTNTPTNNIKDVSEVLYASLQTILCWNEYEKKAMIHNQHQPTENINDITTYRLLLYCKDPYHSFLTQQKDLGKLSLFPQFTAFLNLIISWLLP